MLNPLQKILWYLQRLFDLVGIAQYKKKKLAINPTESTSRKLESKKSANRPTLRSYSIFKLVDEATTQIDEHAKLMPPHNEITPESATVQSL